jgi:hypothetical protein
MTGLFQHMLVIPAKAGVHARHAEIMGSGFLRLSRLSGTWPVREGGWHERPAPFDSAPSADNPSGRVAIGPGGLDRKAVERVVPAQAAGAIEERSALIQSTMRRVTEFLTASPIAEQPLTTAGHDPVKPLRPGGRAIAPSCSPNRQLRGGLFHLSAACTSTWQELDRSAP